MLAAITVVLDGVLVPSSRPVMIVDQTTMVPLRPYIAVLASHIGFDAHAGTVSAQRGSVGVSLRLGSLSASIGERTVELGAAPFLSADTVYVPLAAVARGLGDTVVYRAAGRIIEVGSAAQRPLSTMTPFDPAAPQASPTTIFTRAPTAKPTERPVLNEIPRPRRTPIAVKPSWP